jgi:hypothetical protein
MDRFDQRFRHVESNAANAVTDGERMSFWEFLDCRRQSFQKLIISFDRGSSVFCVVRHGSDSYDLLRSGF